MEAIVIILLIVILVLVAGIKSGTAEKLRALDEKIDIIKAELKATRLKSEEQRQVIQKSVSTEHASTASPKPHVAEPLSVQEKLEKPVEVTPQLSASVEVPKPQVVKVPVVITPPVTRPVAPPKPPKPGFFERNPDLEKFIGENLANKIGIGVLVLGIGFFVKYAIDRDWINEIGRVFIGVLCGGILLGVAHWLRKTFSAFSSVLVGGGIAVLYLTIAIAFHEYQIFSQTAAFILMLIITGFAVVLSLAYNRMELAVLSILGGFASPFMVSSGDGNYVVLFTYVLILDVGMLVLAYYKKWNLVNIICYAFTILLFGGWLAARFDETEPRLIIGAMIFATLYYLVFFAMNIVNNIKERTPFKGIEISMLLSNTFFYYGAGMVILSNPAGADFKGLFTATLGVFNFLFAYMFYKNSRVDKNLVFLLIGLVLTFISLAAPVQLEGNYITLFWAAETVLVLWLSQKSGIRLMKLASVVLMLLMIVSLVMDWLQIYESSRPDTLRIIFNKGYITGLFAIASVALTLILLRNERTEDKDLVKGYRVAMFVALGLVVYVSQFLELQYQLFQYGFEYSTQNVIIGAYNFLFILVILLSERKWIHDKSIKFGFALWGALAMIAYVAYYHGAIILTRNEFVLNNGTITGFVFHYILLGLMIAIAIITLKKIQGNTAFNVSTGNAYSWVFVIFFVFLASSELDHLLVVTLGGSGESVERILTQNHKIGFPILWGLASFLLIFMGLKTKKKHMRIVSLSLFLFTLLKLFIVDIRGISEGGKIAAFISLGVLLLVVSFMYQRLKKILLTDEAIEVKKTDETA